MIVRESERLYSRALFSFLYSPAPHGFAMSGGSVVKDFVCQCTGLDLILEFGEVTLEKDMAINSSILAWEIRQPSRSPTGHTKTFTPMLTVIPLILGI